MTADAGWENLFPQACFMRAAQRSAALRHVSHRRALTEEFTDSGNHYRSAPQEALSCMLRIACRQAVRIYGMHRNDRLAMKNVISMHALNLYSHKCIWHIVCIATP